MTEDWLAMEQTERGDARRLARIRHSMKHKAAKKPEAPVTVSVKNPFEERHWRWDGETIESKGLHPGVYYAASMLRTAGFKLPKLKKGKERYD